MLSDFLVPKEAASKLESTIGTQCVLERDEEVKPESFGAGSFGTLESRFAE